MAVISGYVEAMARLKKRVKDAQGHGDGDDDGAQMTSPAKLRDWFSSNCCLRHPLLESRNSTKFSRYLIWFESVQGILLERSGDDVRLFPCALPCPEVLRIRTAVDETEAQQVWAKQLLNTFIAWSNFVVLGCPDGACEPQAAYRFGVRGSELC